MVSYPFIQDLFTAILSKSKAIQGRVYMCSKGGSEINLDLLGEVLMEVKPATTQLPKYPLVLMLPPRSQGQMMGMNNWEEFEIYLFFLKTTYYDSSNQVSSINRNTRTSQHTLLQDWHDMKRCANSFLKVLDNVQTDNMTPGQMFRVDKSKMKFITPVSHIGVDRASGVRLTFYVSLFTGCGLEDYNENDLNSITIPALDSHPEHKM